MANFAFLKTIIDKLSRHMTSYSKMQEMKRAIYAMRNGVVADALRSAGSPYRFIMGVNLPQLKEIAGRFGRDAALAAELRADTACRESQLMAPLVADPDAVDAVDAQKWLLGSTSREATDILCHALLRHRGDALDLARGALSGEVESDDVRYAGLRLLWNLVAKYPAEVLELAEAEIAAGRPSTSRMAQSLADEARFILGVE